MGQCITVTNEYSSRKFIAKSVIAVIMAATHTDTDNRIHEHHCIGLSWLERLQCCKMNFWFYDKWFSFLWFSMFSFHFTWILSHLSKSISFVLWPSRSLTRHNHHVQVHFGYLFHGFSFHLFSPDFTLDI